MKQIVFWSILILAIVISYVFSILTLDSQSIRLDEAQSLWGASKPLMDVLVYTASDVHVPLYNVLLHFWIQLFGTSIVTLRILSLIFSVATLPVLFILAKEASNQRIAILTVILFAISPFMMWYGNEARMYSLFTFTTTLNQLYFLRLVRSNGKTNKFAYFITTVLGVYSHYFFLFLLFTQGVFSLFLLFKRVITEHDENSQALSWWDLIKENSRLPITSIGLGLVGCLFLIPWVLYVISLGQLANSEPLIPKPTSFNLLQTITNFVFGFQNEGIEGTLISLWPISILVLFFVFTQRRRVEVHFIDYFVLASFLPIGVVFLGSYLWKPIYLSRYLILVTPTLFFLLALVLLNHSRRVATILSSFFIVLMLGLLFYQNTSASTPVVENYRGVDEYLNIQTTPSDIVAVSAPFTIYPIEYGYSGPAGIVTIPYWNRYLNGPIPGFSLANLKGQMESYQKLYTRIYVVLSYDQGYQGEVVSFLDHHYQLLQIKEFSPGLSVRVYKLRY